MNIELRDVLTIENKEYVVACKMVHQGERYIYLVNLADNADVRFCLEKEGRIFEVFDSEIIDALLEQVASNMQ